MDSGGDVGLCTSIALDSADHPRISYHDDTKFDLKYAHYDGLSWHIETVDSGGDVGGYNSIALDSADHPHISYYDWTNEDLKYAFLKQLRLMILRQRTDGKYKLQIYDVPTSVGGNTGSPIASDNSIGLNILDIAGGECDGNAGEELAVMRGTPGKARKLFIYSMPDEVGGNTGPAIASDRWFGKYRDYMTVGNFDADPEPEVAAVQFVSAKDIYRLFIYDMPTTVGGDTGEAVASDRNIGRNVIGIAAANFDTDPEDELVIVRLRADGKHKLQIYDVPTTVGGNTGSPIVSDNNIGRYIITCGVAAGNFDDDPEPEVAVVRLLASGIHKLVIHDAPTSVGGDTGPPIATDNNIGKNIAAIAACEFAPGP